jgi:A/G-specific adenine glycosylase
VHRPTLDEFASSPAFPNSAWKRRFRRRLLSWFRRHARDLPWRETRDPYHIWISEIMLQQTQVVTVIGYFHRFLQAFPTIADLACADEDRVLRLWEGLGYYRRARQLHKAAKIIVDEHEGLFPRDIETIRSLPGIGRYTAGAIASIAWDARQPILEANTTRVLARLVAYRDDPTRTAGQKLLWELAESLLPRKNAGAFNQALMELGSEVCAPRQPLCDQCPIEDLCPTNAMGLQDSIPAPKKKTAYEDITEAAVVVRRRDKALLRRCGDDERWSGLWDFPRFRIVASQGEALHRELEAKVAELTGLVVKTGRKFATIRHGVTRFRITLFCHEARCVRGRLRGENMSWVKPEQLWDYPLSVTGRKISELLT